MVALIHPTESDTYDWIVHIRDQLRALAELTTNPDTQELLFEIYATLGYLAETEESDGPG